ncbi:MAG: hypothetical protein KF700_08190 [Hyphomonadaceae bacterium]|nr:hypothetical protein [Hyphomonadaceae bacterium]
MRRFALAAAAAGLGLTMAGIALAAPWTDPGGRVTFDAPSGWSIQQERGANPSDGNTYVIVGNAANECQVKAQPNPRSAASNPGAIYRTAATSTQFDSVYWTQAAAAFPSLFSDGPATVVSHSVENTGPWPVQRAVLRSGARTVYAGLQLRPGVDLLTMCMSYEGADPVQRYDAFIRSVGHPNDATWAAQLPAAAPSQ